MYIAEVDGIALEALKIEFKVKRLRVFFFFFFSKKCPYIARILCSDAGGCCPKGHKSATWCNGVMHPALYIGSFKFFSQKKQRKKRAKYCGIARAVFQTILPIQPPFVIPSVRCSGQQDLIKVPCSGPMRNTIRSDSRRAHASAPCSTCRVLWEFLSTSSRWSGLVDEERGHVINGKVASPPWDKI